MYNNYNNYGNQRDNYNSLSVRNDHRLMYQERDNQILKIEKEFQKNRNEEDFENFIAEVRQNFTRERQRFIYPSQDCPLELPSTLLAFSSEIVQGTTFSPMFGVMATIGALSVASSRIPFKIQASQDWLESPSLNIIISAEAGTQKSSICQTLREPFDDFQNKESQSELTELERKYAIVLNKKTENEYINEMQQQSRELFGIEKINYIKECAKELKERQIIIKTKKQLLIENCTPSGLLKFIDNNLECGGAITAEGDVIDAMLLNKSADIPLFNKLYTSEPYYKKTYRQEINLQQPRFSSVNFIQNHIARKLYSKRELIDSGATARLLTLFHDSSNRESKSYGRNDKIIKTYRNKIIKILQLAESGDIKHDFVMSLDRLASKKIMEFKETVQNKFMPYSCVESLSILRKLHGFAVRIACAIHVWIYDEPFNHKITAETVTIVIDLCIKLKEHIDWAFDPKKLQSYEIAAKIYNNLKQISFTLGHESIGRGWISSRTIQQRVNVKADKVHYALRYLEMCNLVRVVDYGNQSNIVVLPHNFNDLSPRIY